MKYGLKQIAGYVSEKLKRPFSEDALRRALRRCEDPFPLTPIATRYVMRPDTGDFRMVDDWCARQLGRRLKQAAAKAA